MRRKPRLLALLLITVLATGCGSSLLDSFQSALRTARPFVNALVVSGAISQPKADLIIADFDDGIECGKMLQERFNAIPKTLPVNEIRLRKFEAAQQAKQCFQAIMVRGNFTAHPRVQQASLIADGILASIVAFYAPSPMEGGLRDEKELEKELKPKIKELRKALKR